MPQISTLFDKPVPKLAKKLTPEYATPLLMGLEIEVEQWQGAELPTTLNKSWELIRDNSLRNEGVEFVMRKPKHSAYLIKAISEISSFLDSHPFELSHRCSVHCHIDFRGADTDTLEKFFLLYMLLEPSLYTVSSKDRYNNIYCPGITHTTGLLQQAAIGFAREEWTMLSSSWNKYTGINLHPLISQGSVEIRTHQGTGSGEDLLLWTRILNYIYHAATQLDKETIYNLSSPEELVSVVFSAEDLRSTMLCDNLYTFWSSVMLNMQYYKLVPQVLMSMPEYAEADQQNNSNTELDFDSINSLILRNL